MKRVRVHVHAIYTVPEDSDLEALLLWLATTHYTDLSNVLKLEDYRVSGGRDQAQVFMTVDEDRWQQYVSGSDRAAISKEAKAHGFDHASVMTEYAVITDDDGSPSGGHGPESRGDNLESERGFSGGERGGRG